MSPRDIHNPRSLALVALILVAIYAVVRLADPYQRWAALVLGGDRVEHLIVGYLLVSCALIAFPRIRLWYPALAYAGLGVVVELIQAHPAIVGDAQPGDVVANASGALAATLPMWLARFRKA